MRKFNSRVIRKCLFCDQEKKTIEFSRRSRDRSVLCRSCTEILLARQNNKCAICGLVDVDIALNVDHCHKRNKVRGFLCRKCNVGLGLFKDDVDLLKRAILYLLGQLYDSKSEDIN